MNMQTVTETVKAAPPVTVGVTMIWGLPLSEWAQIAAIVWTIFLLIEKAPVVWQRLSTLYNKLRGRNVHSK